MDDAHSPGGVNTRLACILSRTPVSFPAVPFHSLLNGSNQSIFIPGPFLRGKAGPIRRSGDSGGLTISCHRDAFSLPPRISWHCIRMYMSSSLALSFIYDVIRRLHVLVVRCRNASHSGIDDCGSVDANLSFGQKIAHDCCTRSGQIEKICGDKTQGLNDFTRVETIERCGLFSLFLRYWW